jgi:hypothetical protein
MNINGTVVEVDMKASIAKKDGGSYKGTRLTYRDETGSLKEQAFHTAVLKHNTALSNQLSELKTGDFFTMVKEKEGDFWNVKSIHAQGKAPEGEAAPAQNVKTSPVNASPKSNYETPEERAKRQVLIVRQSSLSSAIALSTALKFKDKKEVLSLAEEFVAFVMQTEYKEKVDEVIEDDDSIN